MNEHHSDQSGRQTNPVAKFLMAHAPVMQQAHQEYAAAGEGNAGALAALRYFTEILKPSIPGLSASDYRAAVMDYLMAGRDDRDAALLWKVGQAENFMSRAQELWTQRYDGRPKARALDAADTMAKNGLLEYSPSSPKLGCEGAAYLPATAIAGSGSEPLLMVAARGDSEMIRGWASEEQMLEWVEARTTTDPGPLAAPPSPVLPRTWGEDMVLAWLLHRPEKIAVTQALLPPSTFTTDVRYEVYWALRELTATPGACTPDVIAEAIRYQLTCVPDGEMVHYGGAGAPFVDQYLARLEQTYVSGNQARAAISALQAQDHQLVVGEPVVRARQPEPSIPNQADGSLLERPPGLEPGGPAGPVPGR